MHFQPEASRGAITALLRHNPTISAVVCYNETIAMGAWFGLLKAGRQSGESGVDRYFEQQVSLAAFTDATPTTLDDIPVTWASTPARELGTTLADRMMQKITHEETHSRNLISCPAHCGEIILSLSAIPGSVLSSRLMIKMWHTGGAFYFY